MSSVTQAYPGSPLADIVVLVAGDVSMAPVADALGDVTANAISHGVQTCPLDVRTAIFCVGTDAFPTKLPTPTLKKYLTDPAPNGLGIPAVQLKEHDPGTPPPDNNYDMENAILDACALFDWRKGASRAILLFANEWPNGGGATVGTSLADAVKTAAGTDPDQPVLIYTCLTAPPTGMTLAPGVASEYTALATQNGGTFTDLSSANSNGVQDGITKMLQTITCALAPATSTQTGGTGSCSSVCDEFSSILCTINLLACALNKAMDACCPGAGANAGCDCGCSDKKKPGPVVTSSALTLPPMALPQMARPAQPPTANRVANTVQTPPKAVHA